MDWNAILDHTRKMVTAVELIESLDLPTYALMNEMASSLRQQQRRSGEFYMALANCAEALHRTQEARQALLRAIESEGKTRTLSA
jgi:hypothetical protein